GQTLQAPPRLHGQRAPLESTGGAPRRLQGGLLVQRLERRRDEVLDLRRGRRSGQPRERGDSPRAEPLDLVAAHPGHEDEVILAGPSLLADFPELAEHAVLDGVRLSDVTASERSLESTTYAPVVRGEVGVAQRPALADPEQHVHRLRRWA